MNDDDEEFLDCWPQSVFERKGNDEAVPEEFSAATLLLDVRASSSLKWEGAFAQATLLAEQGKKILFDLELGFFEKHSKPLSNQTQFQSSVFALSHFRQHLWPHFCTISCGAILCRHTLPIDQAFIDYLELLASELPATCQPFVLLDGRHIDDQALFVSMCPQDRFSRFQLAVQGAPFFSNAAVWQEGLGAEGYIGRGPLPCREPPTVGILIPPFEQPLPEQLNQIVNRLSAENILFKIIPESNVTMEWDGLETIILSYENLSLGAKRALDGFMAAGGEVVSSLDFIL